MSYSDPFRHVCCATSRNSIREVFRRHFRWESRWRGEGMRTLLLYFCEKISLLSHLFWSCHYLNQCHNTNVSFLFKFNPKEGYDLSTEIRSHKATESGHLSRSVICHTCWMVEMVQAHRIASFACYGWIGSNGLLVFIQEATKREHETVKLDISNLKGKYARLWDSIPLILIHSFHQCYMLPLLASDDRNDQRLK